MGDFNINDLVKSLTSIGLFQLVSEVTRPTSKTCLDHVYTTHSNFISDEVVADIGISDHLPIFVSCRKFTNLNQNQLLADLSNIMG